MTEKEIVTELKRKQDPGYREMQIRIIPTIPAASIIGVRTPELRAFAKKLAKEEKRPAFLDRLPHRCFEENQLHAFIVSEMKDYGECLEELKRFLPFVDNWATCDQMSPKVFKKHRQELTEEIRSWLGSDEPYTVRFGIKMLMEHYLEQDFDGSYPQMVAELRSEEYYVNMMIAWYFATALAKQYDAVLPYIEEHRLDVWTHNKAIQKSVESYRITEEQKAYLKSLKIGKK